MASKKMYFFSVTCRDSSTKANKSMSEFRSAINLIIDKKSINNALDISIDKNEPMIMDILERNDEYLFVRLSKKRKNNSVQKRDYSTYEARSVLTPEEEESQGIELFTYCILGYSHGVLTLVKAQGAPSESAFNRLLYGTQLELDIENIPNSKLIDELYAGTTPEVNGITVEIPTPSAAMLQQLFGVSDKALLESIHNNTASVVICAKPQLRSSLLQGRKSVKDLIGGLSQKQGYKQIKINAKPNSNTKIREYDLFEKYFVYPIEIAEKRRVDGQDIEYTREEMQQEHLRAMCKVYDSYKDLIIAICGR